MEITKLSALLREGGVVGAGGAGFPSYAKLNKDADTIILNCAECEPLLKLHRQVLEFHAEEITMALDEIAKAVEAQRVIIAIKPAYKEAIAACEKAMAKYPDMSIGLLPEIYPAGDEVITIYETTGRVVPPGQIPISVGVTVFNVETALNAARMITESKPVTYKYVTVAGEVKKPCTLKVPLGITYKQLVDLAGGATIENPVYFAGGPMTGNIAYPTDVVTKTSNALLILPENQYIIEKRKTPVGISLKRAMSACCQCMMCTDLCSRNLLGHPIEPHNFMRVSSSGVTTDTEPYLNTYFCSSCGLCELYSCFQGLNPRTLIGMTKGSLRKNGIPMPKDIEFTPVDKHREYRTVPMSKLVLRLGLKKYDVPCPLDETLVSADSVKIMLSQSIGAASVPCVKVSDTVNVGDKVGEAPEKLGTCVHASISGVVTEVTDKYVVIKAK